MTAPTNLNIKSKSNEAALAESLAAGTQKHLSTMSQLLVGGGTYTPTQAEAQLSALATLRNDVDAARTALETKLAAEKAQIATLRTFLVAYVAFVRATFGNSPGVLADFGLAPRKAPTPLTAEQKTAAAAKRAATRAARGTEGKKAKLAKKGNVTGVVVTPVTSAPSTGASPAPEPAQPEPTASPATPSSAPAAATATAAKS
jgi:hypothetical protein